MPLFAVPMDDAAKMIITLGFIVGVITVGVEGTEFVKDTYADYKASQEPQFEWSEHDKESNFKPWLRMRDEVLQAIPGIVHSHGAEQYQGIPIEVGTTDIEVINYDTRKRETRDIWALITKHRSPVLWAREISRSYKKDEYEFYNRDKEHWISFSVAIASPLYHDEFDFQQEDEYIWQELIVSAFFETESTWLETPNHVQSPLRIVKYHIKAAYSPPDVNITSISAIESLLDTLKAPQAVPFINAPWFHLLTDGEFSIDECPSNAADEVCAVLAHRDRDLTSPIGVPKSRADYEAIERANRPTPALLKWERPSEPTDPAERREDLLPSGHPKRGW